MLGPILTLRRAVQPQMLFTQYTGLTVRTLTLTLKLVHFDLREFVEDVGPLARAAVRAVGH